MMYGGTRVPPPPPSAPGSSLLTGRHSCLRLMPSICQPKASGRQDSMKNFIWKRNYATTCQVIKMFGYFIQQPTLHVSSAAHQILLHGGRKRPKRILLVAKSYQNYQNRAVSNQLTGGGWGRVCCG
jgi:hypothetical protein